MNRADHFFIGVGAGNRQNTRVSIANLVGLYTHTTGDNHLAVLADGLTDRIQRLLFGGIDKSAGVDHNNVSVVIGRHNIVAVQPELRENALGVDESLGTTEADETDFAVAGRGRGLGVICHRRLGIPGAQREPTNE